MNFLKVKKSFSFLTVGLFLSFFIHTFLVGGLLFLPRQYDVLEYRFPLVEKIWVSISSLENSSYVPSPQKAKKQNEPPKFQKKITERNAQGEPTNKKIDFLETREKEASHLSSFFQEKNAPQKEHEQREQIYKDENKTSSSFFSLIAPEILQEKTPLLYPKEARLNGLEGEVSLRLLVNEQGHVIDVAYVKKSGSKSLDQSAFQYAQGLRFKAGIKDGKPIASFVDLDIPFQLYA